LSLFFLAAVYVFGMILVGIRRPQKIAQALENQEIAQREMTLLLSPPIGDFRPATFSARPALSDPAYQVEVVVTPSSFSSDMLVVALTTTAPSGQRATLRALRPARLPEPPPPPPPLTLSPSDTLLIDGEGEPVEPPRPEVLRRCAGCHGDGAANAQVWTCEELSERAEGGNFDGPDAVREFVEDTLTNARGGIPPTNPVTREEAWTMLDSGGFDILTDQDVEALGVYVSNLACP
jgi:hypothetical protein